MLLAGLTAAAAVSLVYFDAGVAIRRRLRNAPQHTTVSFPDDTVGVVQGVLRHLGDEPLEAPLTGRPCAYYEVAVTLQLGDAVTELVQERRGQDFLLQDEHGLARVSMHNYNVYVVKDTYFQSSLRQRPPPHVEAFLAKHGVTSWVPEEHVMRFHEGVLEAAETVAVCGYGTREVDPDPRAATYGYRDNALRLVLSARSDFPLCISDDIAALRQAPGGRAGHTAS